MSLISPQRLREVRKGQPLRTSQAQLAKKSIVGKRQIQRIEGSSEELVAIQDGTLNKLAKALGVDVDVLTGIKPVPESIRPLAVARTTTIVTSPPEKIDVRLIKLHDAYAVVEFSESEPIGSIIARDVPNEAAGLRLASYALVRQWLQSARDWVMESGFAGEDMPFWEWEIRLQELCDIVSASADEATNAIAPAGTAPPAPSAGSEGGGQ